MTPYYLPGFIKFSSLHDWDWQEVPMTLIKDKNSLKQKRADHSLLKYERTPGQTDFHLIALGACPTWPSNRNGDMFKEAWCKANYLTFKRADRAFHKHHKNKPSDPKFGNIKDAAWNEDMQRIELIVGLDDDKCQDIYHEYEKNGMFNTSMACKVPYDICTWCGRKAPDDSKRCQHIKTKLGEIRDDGVICAMDNWNPNWFEISYVKRGADRISSSLTKLSGEGVTNVKQAEFFQMYQNDLYLPLDVRTDKVLSKKASDKRWIFNKLAQLEKRVNAIAVKADSGSDKLLHDRVAKLAASSTLSDSTIDELRKHSPEKVLKLLADSGIVFSPVDFAKYVFGDRIDKKSIEGMKTHLPDICEKLEGSDDLFDVLNEEKFEPEGLMSGMPKGIKELISGLMGDHSLFDAPARNRVIKITIAKLPRKDISKKEEASKEALDKTIANYYMNYKLASLNYMLEHDILDDEVLLNAVIQNRQ